jgi:ice-binding like protein/PEP-CTERM motif-containing protein
MSLRTRPALFTLASLFLVCVTAAPAPADAISLGAAGDYAVLGLTGGKIDLSNPQTTVQGNLGLGPRGVQNFSDGIITGNYVLDPTADNSHHHSVRVQGSTITQSLTQAVNDAVSAANAIAALTPTQTFASITHTSTITANGSTNVITVTGQIKLDGGDTLTLRGGANDFFYIKVAQGFGLTGGSAIQLTGGVTASHVIFSITGDMSETGGGHGSSGGPGSQGVGTFLDINGKISISDSTVTGAIIGGMNSEIALTSGSHINQVPFQQTPEPGSMLLLGLGGLGCALFGCRLRKA